MTTFLFQFTPALYLDPSALETTTCVFLPFFKFSVHSQPQIKESIRIALFSRSVYDDGDKTTPFMLENFPSWSMYGWYAIDSDGLKILPSKETPSRKCGATKRALKIASGFSRAALAISDANACSFFFSLIEGNAGQMIKSEEANVEVELPRKYSPPRRLIKFSATSFSPMHKPSNKLNFTFAKG